LNVALARDRHCTWDVREPSKELGERGKGKGEEGPSAPRPLLVGARRQPLVEKSRPIPSFQLFALLPPATASGETSMGMGSMYTGS